MTNTEMVPTAAAAGASASAAFKATKRLDPDAIAPERLAAIVSDILAGVHAAIRTHDVGYAEYQAAKGWLIEVGETGEWPLLLDVLIEHVIEAVASRTQQGTKGSILGPFYLPDQQRLPAVSELPRRTDEKGTSMVLSGRVRAIDGTPLAGATLDIWQADGEGYYSGFAPHVPDGNLRGVVVVDEDGRFEVGTIEPAPYQIPTDGPTGALLRAAGWHAWRPAHLHLLVAADGYRPVTTQLYFAGGEWLDSDVADAVKPELVLDPRPDEHGVRRSAYDFVLEPAPDPA